MKQYVVSKLGATERAWDMMLKTQDGAKKLLDTFWRNDPEDATPVPTLCFAGVVLELSAARLMHGGKLSGDEDEPGLKTQSLPKAQNAVVWPGPPSSHVPSCAWRQPSVQS